MSAIDPLSRMQKRGGLRSIDRADLRPEGETPRRRFSFAGIKSTYRPADANFFCWKYGVWYNLMDCCYRHDHRTFTGCAPCGQGALNLKTNAERYRALRHLGDPPRPKR